MLMTLIAGSSKWQSLLMARDDDKVFMTRSLNIMPKTAEQHLIVCSGKSKAEATVLLLRVHSSYCTIEANSDRHSASRGLSATADLLEYECLAAFAICIFLRAKKSSQVKSIQVAFNKPVTIAPVLLKLRIKHG